VLFVGDDWAEDHHDVEIQDETGRRLGRARLPEGVAGVARLHELIGAHLAEDAEPGQVAIGIETDRGPWVQALVAAGYTVYAVNPRQVARYRERHGTSGAKSDAGDAHTLADMVRTDRHQLRPVAGDSEQAQAVKVVARAHQTLIWDRQRHMLRLRTTLREFYPAALEAFADLTASDALELLAEAPDPDRAARLSPAQVTAALCRARRRNVEDKAAAIQAALRTEHLAQPPAVAAAYAATVRSLVSLISVFNAEIAAMEEQVTACFGRTRDAEVYLSQPGLGQVLAARVLARVRRRRAPLRHREEPQELRRHQPGHPPVRQEEDRTGPLRPQRPARRRPTPAGVLRPASLRRRPRLLRPAPRPRHGPPRRATPTVQPAGRHPARLPQDQHPLQRTHRLGTPQPRSTNCRLTTKIMGCLSPRWRSATGLPPVKCRMTGWSGIRLGW
jgi:transposase